MDTRLLRALVVLVIFTSAQCSSTQAQVALGAAADVSGSPIVKQGAKGHSDPDLTGYTLAFDEEFDGPLSVSAYGPGTKWIAHTPYKGDFGEAWFTEPTYSPSPFSIKDGILTITAWKDPSRNNHWRSGLLSSIDTKANGFAQALGYYEARMKLPAGPGVWPAFWLDGLGSFKTPKTKVAEIDILEEYGVDARIAHQAVHVWNTDGSQYAATGNSSTLQGMTTGFHTYGALIKTDYIYFYFDGVELWKTPTPPEAKEPLYVMVDLALGGGWPIDQTPNPSHLYVDYIRVYAPPPSPTSSATGQDIGLASDWKD
jgi:beta-glucanase (GH16 family)